jgi:hypothetical protein
MFRDPEQSHMATMMSIVNFTTLDMCVVPSKVALRAAGCRCTAIWCRLIVTRGPLVAIFDISVRHVPTGRRDGSCVDLG